jgi:Ni/Co efflux regulator RcnB
MKRLFVFAVALGFLACVPASAQSNGHGGGKHNAGKSGATHESNSAGAHQNNQGRAMMGGVRVEGVGTARSMRARTPTSTTTEGRFLPSSGDVRSAQTGRSMGDRSRNNSGWSGNTATRQPSINSLRLNVQSSRRFHHGDYRMPAGYQTRHWGYGERLPRGYFVRDYWIADFLMFGLFAPPTDLVWVRVGYDALLVDRYSGDIVQVRYDVFY